MEVKFASVRLKDKKVFGGTIKLPACASIAPRHFSKTTRAFFDWVNDQPLAPVVTCLGDGHDGIWNIISEIAPLGERREILDWYHLVENLHKVGGSCRRLNQAESLNKARTDCSHHRSVC